MEKWGKELKIFTVPKGQNIILEKGGGAKISYFGQIYNHEIIDGAIHQHFIYKKQKKLMHILDWQNKRKTSPFLSLKKSL